MKTRKLDGLSFRAGRLPPLAGRSRLAQVGFYGGLETVLGLEMADNSKSRSRVWGPMLAVLALFLNFAVNGGAVAGSPSDPKAGSGILVVYIGAFGCMYCNMYEGGVGEGSRAEILKLAEQKRIEYRELKMATYKITNAELEWPEDLRWIIDKTNVRSGTPRYLVVVDGKIKMNTRGLQNFSGRLMPYVRDLLKDREGAKAPS